MNIVIFALKTNQIQLEINGKGDFMGNNTIDGGQTAKSVLLKRYESSRKGFNKYLFTGIFLAFLGIASFCIYNGAVVGSNWGGSYIEIFEEAIFLDKEIVLILKLTTILVSVVGILGGVLSIFRIMAVSKMNLKIYSDKIVGAGAPSYIMLFTREFALKYEDILSVEMEYDIIVIIAAAQTYKLEISNQKEAFIELQKAVNEHRA